MTKEKLLEYLHKVIYFLGDYVDKIENDNMFGICDKILDICKMDEYYDEIALIALGMKSDISDEEQKVELQNEILERGKKKSHQFY